jgi:peptide/nickel transport system ATP-binding protein
MTPLLDAIDLHKQFGGVHAVNGVSLIVNSGETLGIVGESGCGKSTTAKLLLRLLDPDGGSISFAGTDVTRLRGRSLREFRSKVQVVPQNPQTSLNPRLTVRSSIEFNMRVHGIASPQRKATIAELLERVGLDPSHGERFPHELSGGQLQRAAIARALATGPELIICDEAVSALDKSVQAQVLNLLVQLQRDLGMTYVFISHDLAVIEHLSDRVAVMYLGQIVEEGTASCPFSSRCPEVEPRCLLAPPLLRQAPPTAPDDARHHLVACIHVPEPVGTAATFEVTASS